MTVRKKKGAALPPFRTPCKGASPLDPIISHSIIMPEKNCVISVCLNLLTEAATLV